MPNHGHTDLHPGIHVAGKVILNMPMELMGKEQQEEVWRLSREKEVFIRDVNGSLWQVLDLTTEEADIVLLALRAGVNINLVRDKKG